MKNIFKLMGIALIAGSMFAACGGNEGNEGGEDNGGNSNAEALTVVFNGEDVSAKLPARSGVYYTDLGMTVIDFRASAGNNIVFPSVQIYTLFTSPNSGSATFNDENLELDGEPGVCEYYEETALQSQQSNGQTAYYGDWWAETASLNMKTFDVTANKTSFTIEATMFNAAEAYVPSYGQVGRQAASHAQLKVEANNIPFIQKQYYN